MKEFTISKPRTLNGYPIHRAVAALAKGAPHIWRDNGETVTIRTAATVDVSGSELPQVREGELRMFDLRACVSSKTNGRHKYPPLGDYKARQAWLARQAERHGFSVLAVHATSRIAKVADQAGRNFTLDSTDFSGVLKVTDPTAFHNALCSGVGSTGRAFGFSLLAI